MRAHNGERQFPHSRRGVREQPPGQPSRIGVHDGVTRRVKKLYGNKSLMIWAESGRPPAEVRTGSRKEIAGSQRHSAGASPAAPRVPERPARKRRGSQATWLSERAAAAAGGWSRVDVRDPQ